MPDMMIVSSDMFGNDKSLRMTKNSVISNLWAGGKFLRHDTWVLGLLRPIGSILDFQKAKKKKKLISPFTINPINSKKRERRK